MNVTSPTAAGINISVYDAATNNIQRNQRVEELNLNQPEFSRPVWLYLDSAVSAKRVADGQQALAANLQTLSSIEAKYGVPKEVVVSIWGNESDFGHGHETFNMFEALATLAYDGPRADYAKPEFLAALKIMQQQKFDPAIMTSSWAGRVRADAVHADDISGACRRWRWRRHDRSLALQCRCTRLGCQCAGGCGMAAWCALGIRSPIAHGLRLRSGRCRYHQTRRRMAQARCDENFWRSPSRDTAERRDLPARGCARTGVPGVRQFQGRPQIQQRRVLRTRGSVFSRIV